MICEVLLIAFVKVKEGLDCVELFDVLDDFLNESSFALMDDEVRGKGGAREMRVLVRGGMDDGVDFGLADMPVTWEPNVLGGFGSS